MNKTHITLRSYILGFVLSLLFTLCAYWVVVSHSFNPASVVGLILVFAFFQLITQLVFFLHLAQEQKPRWQQFIFFTTVIGIGILVIGSIWIMNHLTNRMTSEQMGQFFMHDEGISQ